MERPANVKWKLRREGCVKFLTLCVGAGSPRPIGSYNTGEGTSPLRGAAIFVNDFDKIFTHPGANRV